MKFIKNYFFVIFFNLIVGVLLEDILQRNESKKTNNDYIIFNSSSFSIGDEMYFEIKSKGDCDDILYYQYYDNVSSIDYNNTELYYNTKSTSSSSSKVNGKIKSLSLYYTIKKKENELDGLKGDYLFFNFDCDESVEFVNSKKNNNLTTILAIVAAVIILSIACILIIRYCRKRRMEGVIYEEGYNYPYQGNPYPIQGIPYPNQGIPYPNQGNPYPYPYPNSSGMSIPQQNGNSTFIYQNNPNMIINNPNNNNHNIGKKVKHNKGAGKKKIKIFDKGMIPGPQSASNSDALQKLEKPKV